MESFVPVLKSMVLKTKKQDVMNKKTTTTIGIVFGAASLLAVAVYGIIKYVKNGSGELDGSRSVDIQGSGPVGVSGAGLIGIQGARPVGFIGNGLVKSDSLYGGGGAVGNGLVGGGLIALGNRVSG
ncbi:hypothetical protein G8759_14710 [Spirosoma aureum]|uniref:Uncharacterized protein n=1 Tax=Spirosoma aureum TaxID=2692134 RepID=A0A6G9ANC4_9BACT|nr:hypothetical protein [Spirosoma aureum]QIP13775.1 hypothetical protein G8759_14710 [Spirosoma aureum]